MADTTHTNGDRIPLVLIHGAWLSARSWENYADYFRSSCRNRGLCHRPGRGGQRPPRESIARAIAA